MAVGMIDETSAFGRLQTFHVGLELKSVLPNNDLQSDAPGAARA
jgi:hypothetical protein